MKTLLQFLENISWQTLSRRETHYVIYIFYIYTYIYFIYIYLYLYIYIYIFINLYIYYFAYWFHVFYGMIPCLLWFYYFRKTDRKAFRNAFIFTVGWLADAARGGLAIFAKGFEIGFGKGFGKGLAKGFTEGWRRVNEWPQT